MIDKILTGIFTIAECTLKFSFEFIETAILASIPKGKEGYNASFASTSTLLSSKHEGWNLTGDKSLSVKNSFQNSIIFGGTGVGKSSVVLIPCIYSMKSSFVIHDPSGELLFKSSGYLESKGYRVKILNFADPSISSGYNPLVRANSSSEIQKVASLLISTSLGNNAKDPFWNTQAIALLAMLISILKKRESQYQNLFNVRQLLNQMGGSPEKVDKLFSEYADEILFNEFKGFISADDKVVSGVVATCKAALQIFVDDDVARVTSFDNIDFQEFREKPVALFIQNKISEQKYFSTLTSLFFEQFFAFVMSRFTNKGEQDIFFLIDEAGSLKLPTLQLAVANVRKHNAGIMQLYQSYEQVVHNYGKHEADAIKSNCFAKMYFTGQNLETSRELESVLGKFEYTEKDKEGKDGRKVTRSLMTADEIRVMKLTEALLICGHHLPMKIKLCPYYKNKTYNNYSTMPVPELQSYIPEIVPVLPIHNSKSQS